MILIDTTPLVALCDAHDSKHRMALKHLESLAPEELAVCDAVLMEACFHLPHRNQRLRLQALLNDLSVQAIPITYERDFFLEVFDWLTKYADHEPDWADACLAILSARDKDLKVWTYDREFRTTWRRPNGTTIPLALRSIYRGPQP
ncbi:MAG TPA: type II toxin-antitoxin system VapC family toxin [Terriglobales bacterium]|nr:type II toxin-antitoxin system VapC family toxin [Terriglobales bacterium]